MRVCARSGETDEIMMFCQLRIKQSVFINRRHYECIVAMQVELYGVKRAFN